MRGKYIEATKADAESPLGIVFDQIERNSLDAKGYAALMLLEAAPDLLAALKKLQIQANHANAIQHSGVKVGPAIWADLYQTCNEARAVIARAEGGAA